MKSIGLVVRSDVPDAIPLAKELVKWCKDNGHAVVGSKETASISGVTLDKVVPEDDLAFSADPIVTLGGDGTLIGVARRAKESAPVLLGVNFGTLGFLTEISPEDCLASLKEVLAGDACLGKREMLRAQVFREGKSIFECQAVNEALVQKGTRERLLTLEVKSDDNEILQLKGDGLIISTPTGSTAYSLAAGGSIVHPNLSVILLSPVCAHSLTARPLILPSDMNISVGIPGDYDGEVFLLVDGQESCLLQANDEVRVERSPHSVNFVQSKTKTYFEILRTKLRWGLRNLERGVTE
ncbi:MAG: NAD(+)/NADH kinase [Planctomycetaceae bacterium]|nr:NAD(+)/NADH kinase [Planctomycetaceae bacterium]